ncbi:MAG: NUDIX hydrolase [Polyangiales bacterium]
MITREVVERALLRPRHGRRILPADPPPIPAAVAVPISFSPAHPGRVYAVLRGKQLRDHAGEVGFPGGKVEPGDADLRATALRELGEEVAIHDAEPLGALTPVPVITGRYLIHPFVVALGETVPSLASEEIAAILPVDLEAYLSGDRIMGGVQGTYQGHSFVTPHFDLEKGLDKAVLYGASAFVLYELLVLIAGELGQPLPPPRIVTEPPWGDRY